MANFKPEPYHTATAYLIVHDGAAALDFYTKAFDAIERMRMPGPDGRIGHSEFTIGDSILMLADEHPEIGALSPRTIGGASVSIALYVPDCDASIAQAVAAGATITRPAEDKFWGDRDGSIKDPFGYIWHLMTHVRDVSDEEMAKAAAEFAG
jgi:PhnB protein